MIKIATCCCKNGTYINRKCTGGKFKVINKADFISCIAYAYTVEDLPTAFYGLCSTSSKIDSTGGSI